VRTDIRALTACGGALSAGAAEAASHAVSSTLLSPNSPPWCTYPRPAASRLTTSPEIVVFDVPLTEFPEPAFLLIQYPGSVYDPNGQVLTGGTYKLPFLNGLAPVLDQLEAAGAAGGVGVLDYPEEAVTGADILYDGILRNVLGLLVDRDVGADLKAQAQQGISANIALPAQVADVNSRNIVAVIPGKNYGTTADEVVIIHSHTDGTNGLEDNGPYIATATA
jgi:hypothetical protein